MNPERLGENGACGCAGVRDQRDADGAPSLATLAPIGAAAADDAPC